jgi:hypothetical protein
MTRVCGAVHCMGNFREGSVRERGTHRIEALRMPPPAGVPISIFFRTRGPHLGSISKTTHESYNRFYITRGAPDQFMHLVNLLLITKQQQSRVIFFAKTD